MTNLADILLDKTKLYIVGEISCNHNNEIKTILDTIDGLVNVGADAVKIQTDAIDGTGSTMDFRTPYFTVGGGTIWDGVNLMDLYKEAYTPLEWHEEIFEHCAKRRIECFSTPYSNSTIEFLKDFNMPAVKIASMEANDLSFVRRCAQLGVPIIISTGMIDLEGAKQAVEACHAVGNYDVILLKCTSEYPAKIEDMQLAAIPKLREQFGVTVGLSDHTLTHVAPVVATALGAQVLEKHVKLNESIGGPDSEFSLTVEQFGEMVRLCNDARASMGSGIMTPKQKNLAYSRSIFVIKDVEAGEEISSDNVRVIRPGHGLPPNDLDWVLGKRFARPVKAGNPLLREHFSSA